MNIIMGNEFDLIYYFYKLLLSIFHFSPLSEVFAAAAVYLVGVKVRSTKGGGATPMAKKLARLATPPAS